VIGFPQASPIPSEAVAGAFIEEPLGQKYVLPGKITAVEETMITYAAFTLGGTSGGAVVDLDSGHVIGVHFGGRFDAATGVKYGFAVPLCLTADDALWRSPEIGIQALTPPKHPPAETVNFTTGEGWTFEQTVRAFEQVDGKFPSDLSAFTEAERNAIIRKYTIRNTTVRQTLERLGSITEVPGAIKPYSVRLEGSVYVFGREESGLE
jgi:hypothetical protein